MWDIVTVTNGPLGGRLLMQPLGGATTNTAGEVNITCASTGIEGLKAETLASGESNNIYMAVPQYR
jgi:hypothetical protein